MKTKKALVRKSAFFKPPINVIKPLRLYFRSAHTKITEEVVAQALMTQTTIITSGSDKVNFSIM